MLYTGATKLIPTAPKQGLWIGDSITYGFGTGITETPVQAAVAQLIADGFSITGINQGQVGAATADWLPGGTYFNAAVSAANSVGGVRAVSIMLGANDSKTAVATSQATYTANISSIIAGLFSQVYGLQKVVLNQCSYIVPGSGGGQWGSGSDTLLQAYNTALAGLVNGTTIVAGDTTIYATTLANQSLLADGVHFTQAGYVTLGGLWAIAFPTGVL